MKAKKTAVRKSAKATNPTTTREYEAEKSDVLVALRISSEVYAESASLGAKEKKALLKQLSDFEKLLIAVEPAFRNVKSLSFLRQAVIQPWNESSGPDTAKFWKRVADAGLPFKKQNVLLKILRRRKIRDDIEYELAIDALSAGEISGQDANLLNRMIKSFELGELKSERRKD